MKNTFLTYNLAAGPIVSRIFIRYLTASLVLSVHELSRNLINALPDYKEGLAVSRDIFIEPRCGSTRH